MTWLQVAAGTLQVGKPVAVFPASEVLPPDLLRGPRHQVSDRVLNDGHFNMYTLHTAHGAIQVVSTPTLRKRIGEAYAVAAIEQIHPPERIQRGVFDSGRRVFSGVKRLFTQPQDTLQGAGRGVAHLVGLAEEHLQSKPSQAESSALAGLVGLAGCKRELAREFDVDVYSANPMLQAELDHMTWTHYGGSASLSTLKLLIPGGVGTAVGLTGGVSRLNDIVDSASPLSLRRLNRRRLEQMDVETAVVDALASHPLLTPRDQTYLVAALEDLKHLQDKEAFLRFAMRTRHRDLTSHPARIAFLYAGYDRNRAPLLRFEAVGPFVVAHSAEALVLVSPADYLVWNPEVARAYRSVRPRAGRAGGGKRWELWVPGTVTASCRERLQAQGWSVHDRCEAQLLETAPTVDGRI